MGDNNPERARASASRSLAAAALNDESPLAWLRRRRDKSGQPLLSDAEYDAGERLRRDFYFAQMTPRVTVNWALLKGAGGGHRGAPDLGPDVRDAVIAAQDRVRKALAAVGPDLAGVLIDVCCHLKGLERSEKESGWPQRSGKIVLQIALRQLARHYGLGEWRVGADDHVTGRRTQHWGQPDYRPRIDGK